MIRKAFLWFSAFLMSTLLAGVLFYASLVVSLMNSLEIVETGIPLVFSSIDYMCAANPPCEEFHLAHMIFDIVFWYAVSSLIIFLVVRLFLYRDIRLFIENKEYFKDKKRTHHREELDRKLGLAAEEAVPDYLPSGDLYVPDIMDFYEYDEEDNRE